MSLATERRVCHDPHVLEERVVENDSHALLVRKLSFEDLHFYVRSGLIVSAREVYAVVNKTLTREEFRVKRIKKRSACYTRLTVSRSSADKLEQVKKDLHQELRCSLLEQFMKPGVRYERRSTDTTNAIVLSLNTNGVTGKSYELNLLLERYKPDIILLQEARRTSEQPWLRLPRYAFREVTARDGGLGLLIGIRASTNYTLNKDKCMPDSIVANLVAPGISKRIANVYLPHDCMRIKVALRAVRKVLDCPQKNSILIGDWNLTPDHLATRLARKGAVAHMPNAPQRGTRINSLRRRSRRPVDFGICSHPDLILDQRVKTVMETVGPLSGVGDNQHEKTGEGLNKENRGGSG